MLIDHELKLEIEVLERVLGVNKPTPLGISILPADKNAILRTPLGRAYRSPTLQGRAIK